MTPTTLERLVRSSLQAILQGTGTLEERLTAVTEKLSALPASDRARIAKHLRPKLARALRQKSAVLKSAGTLSAAVKERVQKFSQERGMLFTEEKTDEKLLAGFTLQLGDDRLNLSLINRLQSL